MKSSVDLATAHWSNALMKAYLSNDERVRPWIADWPSIEALKKVAVQQPYSEAKRTRLVNALKRQYSHLQPSKATLNNIESLLSNNSFTITTGHQICLATGPLYFIYKIVSAIKLAEKFNAANVGLKAVPVYWMATEDHDAAEISSVKSNNQTFTWDHQQSGVVGEFDTTGIQQWLDQWAPAQYKQVLEQSYALPTLADATRYLVNELFSSSGLVIIDGNDSDLKESMIDLFQQEVVEHPAFQEVNVQTTALINAGFHEQIHAREINLFFLEKGKRTRIEQKDERYQLSDESRYFEKQELLDLIKNQTHLFSPNVIMRPVYQEVILPNLAYIGGQGELAYWLQLKSYFDRVQVSFPILVLRDSALVVSSRTHQRMQKLGIQLSDLEKEQHQVVREVLQQSGDVDLEAEKQLITKAFEPIVEKAKLADATLEATAKAELQKQLTAIENLEKRFFKALKSKEEVKVQQIQKIWDECFPGNGLQERIENFFVMQSETQSQLIPLLMDCFNPLDHSMKIVVVD
ncbi:MAG: bacillithiol biosynthesis cysteine-adding enzyme BshC [Flavobacteriales bacterium]